MDRTQLNAWNSRRLTDLTPHTLIPKEKGGVGCRVCVLAEAHPVHTTPAASNVTVLGGRQRRR